jgi:hypothetical protein
MVRDEEDPLNVQSLVVSPSAAIGLPKAMRESLVSSPEPGKRNPAPGSGLPVYDLHKATLSGAINIIDLANIYSCSFIATDDVGRLYADGSFEVLGRRDGSDVRGCSLMVV